MNSKLKAALTIAFLLGAAAIIFLQYQTRQKMRAENDSLRQQIAQLKSDTPDTAAADSKPVNSDDFNELLRLRGEVSALRTQTNQIAKLQQQNQQLQDSLTNAIQTRQQSATQDPDQRAQERAFGILQINTAKVSVLGMIMYAEEHNDTVPAAFNSPDATNYFPQEGYNTNLGAFEIVYHGTMGNVANPSSAVVVRSIQPWMSNGKWAKAYGFADGHAEVHSVPDGNFDDWEQQHVPVMKSQ
jgi:hypothetical protein